jgi:hypothetical protein
MFDIIDRIASHFAEQSTGITSKALLASNHALDLDALDKEIAARFGRGSIILQAGDIEFKHEIQKELV